MSKKVYNLRNLYDFMESWLELPTEKMVNVTINKNGKFEYNVVDGGDCEVKIDHKKSGVVQVHTHPKGVYGKDVRYIPPSKEDIMIFIDNYFSYGIQYSCVAEEKGLWVVRPSQKMIDFVENHDVKEEVKSKEELNKELIEAQMKTDNFLEKLVYKCMFYKEGSREHNGINDYKDVKELFDNEKEEFVEYGPKEYIEALSDLTKFGFEDMYLEVKFLPNKIPISESKKCKRKNVKKGKRKKKNKMIKNKDMKVEIDMDFKYINNERDFYAFKIQRVFRDYMKRKKNRKMDKSVIKIQSLFRGYKIRKSNWELV